jgi:hypothetical protein
MISPVGSVQSQAASEIAPSRQAVSHQSSSTGSTSTSSPAAVPTDTVTISSAAQAVLKEITETPAQTIKEAAGGDSQAKRLLAKEAANEKL